MKKAADFPYYVSKFLARYLPGEAGASPNTILSYRDTFLLFIRYCNSQEDTPPEKMTLELLTRELVCAFLSWLENERNCSVSTRNQRLAALHSFCRFMQTEDVMRLNQYQLVISIPKKRGNLEPSITCHQKALSSSWNNRMQQKCLAAGLWFC